MKMGHQSIFLINRKYHCFLTFKMYFVKTLILYMNHILHMACQHGLPVCKDSLKIWIHLVL